MLFGVNSATHWRKQHQNPCFQGFFCWHAPCCKVGDMNTLNIRSLDRLMSDMLTDCYSTGLRHSHYGSLEETDDSYVLHAQVPGVGKGDLRLQFKEDILSVRGENKKYKYFKEYLVPDGADTSSFSAELDNGILSVKVSKRPENKPLTIPIN